MNPQLGRLERVDPRTAWASESSDFTPWLAQAENLELLGKAIGIELELEAQEKSVGPFRADILCKDTATDSWVLIENQLARTDHTHLGQLLTYAAGLQAVTIVWIATPFTEEHRAALDWLNQITDSRFNFFGLEVELWRIGTSPFAPKFNIVCKPNDWSKTVAEGVARVEREELTDLRQLQLDFWTHFRNYVDSNSTMIRATKPHPQHWMSLSIGRSGFHMYAVATLWNAEAKAYDEGQIRAEFSIRGANAQTYFQMLLAEKDAIESELGYSLTWSSPDDLNKCKVYIWKSVQLDDRSDWDNQSAWLMSRLEEFRRVFGPRIRSLNI